MEGGWFSTRGSRLRAQHIRLKHLQELHGLRVAPFQHVALALAPRTFLFNNCNSFTGSRGQRTRTCVLERFRTMRVPQSR
eukprot:7256237-Pyramimonas_sp.AAC.1